MAAERRPHLGIFTRISSLLPGSLQTPAGLGKLHVAAMALSFGLTHGFMELLLSLCECLLCLEGLSICGCLGLSHALAALPALLLQDLQSRVVLGLVQSRTRLCRRWNKEEHGAVLASYNELGDLGVCGLLCLRQTDSTHLIEMGHLHEHFLTVCKAEAASKQLHCTHKLTSMHAHESVRGHTSAQQIESGFSLSFWVESYFITHSMTVSTFVSCQGHPKQTTKQCLVSVYLLHLLQLLLQLLVLALQLHQVS